MGRARGRPRGGGLTELHDRYFHVIGQGVSNSETCRMVGIDRKTGTRWRYGRKICNSAGEAMHYPPVSSATISTPRHPRYLSVEARTVIADLYREKRTCCSTSLSQRPARRLARRPGRAGGWPPPRASAPSPRR